MRRLCILVLVACSACGGTTSNGEGTSLTYGEDAQASYESALSAFRAGKCLEAEPAFRRIRREFPYSRFAALAELRIADCKLDQREYAEAIQAYRQFVRFRPSHSEVPYAEFKIAEAYFRQIPSDWFLAPPAYERDQGPTRDALTHLRRFVVDHSDDSRAAEARDMIERCLRMLAEHEMYVARFYRRRGADRAVVMRLKTLLATYDGSGLEAEALLMLGRAHLRLRERNEARAAFDELVQRFPDSDQARAARSELSDLGPAPGGPTASASSD